MVRTAFPIVGRAMETVLMLQKFYKEIWIRFFLYHQRHNKASLKKNTKSKFKQIDTQREKNYMIKKFLLLIYRTGKRDRHKGKQMYAELQPLPFPFEFYVVDWDTDLCIRRCIAYQLWRLYIYTQHKIDQCWWWWHHSTNKWWLVA